MEDLGWVGDDVWYAHGIYINDDEILRLATSQTGRCPLPFVEYAARIRNRSRPPLLGRRGPARPRCRRIGE